PIMFDPERTRQVRQLYMRLDARTRGQFTKLLLLSFLRQHLPKGALLLHFPQALFDVLSGLRMLLSFAAGSRKSQLCLYQTPLKLLEAGSGLIALCLGGKLGWRNKRRRREIGLLAISAVEPNSQLPSELQPGKRFLEGALS